MGSIAQIRADYKTVARALTRKGNALARLQRYEDAIATYQKALTEHRCGFIVFAAFPGMQACLLAKTERDLGSTRIMKPALVQLADSPLAKQLPWNTAALRCGRWNLLARAAGVLRVCGTLVVIACLCRNADTLKRLQETEKKLKEQQKTAYVDMDASAREREAGNQV